MTRPQLKSGTAQPERHEIVIVRRFPAPRALVFRNWLEADALMDWFAPDTFTTLSARADARPGGEWRVEYRAPDGMTVLEHGIYQEIAAPERLVMTLTQVVNGRANPETTITVTFKETDGATVMTFRQSGFESTDRRDCNAEGWGGCFDQLERRVAKLAAAS